MQLQPCHVNLPSRKFPQVSDEIISLLLENFNVTWLDIVGNNRQRKYVDLRIVFSNIFRVHPNIRLGIKQTGRLLIKDHSSIIWYLKRCNYAHKFDHILYQKLVTSHLLVFGKLDYLNNFAYFPNYKKH
jgi:chromosomal replication initiation ATPase DnaA